MPDRFDILSNKLKSEIIFKETISQMYGKNPSYLNLFLEKAISEKKEWMNCQRKNKENIRRRLNHIDGLSDFLESAQSQAIKKAIGFDSYSI